jgi:hypothetical protein
MWTINKKYLKEKAMVSFTNVIGLKKTSWLAKEQLLTSSKQIMGWYNENSFHIVLTSLFTPEPINQSINSRVSWCELEATGDHLWYRYNRPQFPGGSNISILYCRILNFCIQWQSCKSLPSHLCYMLWPSHLPWFHNINKMPTRIQIISLYTMHFIYNNTENL